MVAARKLRDPDDMAQVCEGAGSLRAECHAQWVTEWSKVLDLPWDRLVAACGPSEDCALVALDHRADPDVLVQISRCDAAGRFRGYCVGHATRRWVLSRPDDAEIVRVVTTSTTDPGVLGAALGSLVECHGRGACPTSPRGLADACAREVTAIRAQRSRCTER